MLDYETIESDLLVCYLQCNVRGLKRAADWASELSISLSKNSDDNNTTANIDKSLSMEMDPEDDRDTDMEMFRHQKSLLDKRYRRALSCFDLGEYDRAAYFASTCRTNDQKFLHFYSRYMSAEKKRLDLMTETTMTINKTALQAFVELRNDLERGMSTNLPDSWLLYVYAIVLLKLDLTSMAITALVQAVKIHPLIWPAWQQLAVVIEDKPHLDSLDLPNHWFKIFFLGIVYMEILMNEEAHDLYTNRLGRYFSNCNYVRSQIATAQNNLRDVNAAISLFKQIRADDPFRLDNMDTYSNLLYVSQLKSELSSLAHSANEIDPFRVETCCCIANFYSLRSQHNKAVVYFSRALQLNPAHIAAWTLMGHEYMEMKNTGAAIQAYRSAINCNKRDYRAWYGLGQTYEIMKQPCYSLYYYSVASNLRPNDFRMIIALGDTYEKLNRDDDAIKCFKRAGGGGLSKLAAMYEKKGDKKKAYEAYTELIQWSKQTGALAPTALDRDSDFNHATKFIESYNSLAAKDGYGAT